MTRRVVVTGSECTGKTTLARELADALDAPWAPEAARAYAEARGGTLSAADVEPIARATQAALEAAAAGAPPVLVADTDLVSTLVYARAYYGACPAWIETACRASLAELYLLCAPDLPWIPDGVRDRPAEADRHAMHAAFADTLLALGARVALVSGRGPARTACALQNVQAALSPSPSP
ncbi:MAG: ATP-binding protein [Gemmatimonadetes bacterium]|nr:ATP-binding protein [Gemmatimonadota bacterium]